MPDERIQEVTVTDPEESVSPLPADLAEGDPDAEQDEDEFAEPIPLEADDRDVVEQRRDVPDQGEDDYA
jgi:hypothetical protein